MYLIYPLLSFAQEPQDEETDATPPESERAWRLRKNPLQQHRLKLAMILLSHMILMSQWVRWLCFLQRNKFDITNLWI